MIKEIDGAAYAALVQSGIERLERHRGELNELNVFPVPDGDTGTNMVMTLRHGYDAIRDGEGSLPEVSRRFSSSAVFGARGNSGVIVSQFFKGMAEIFGEAERADAATFSVALQKGCDYAYAAVASPVEGTILTVMKDAAHAVAAALPLESIDAAVDVFLKEARASLSRTPELLPILKKASVVDSGGSGFVYFFEGVKRHLSGEITEEPVAADAPVADAPAKDAEDGDFSMFDKNTDFAYGYCVEGLIQLKEEVADFRLDECRERLSSYGDSAVISLEGDKLKLHIHTKKLGTLIDRCQRYGEFLTLNIENMSVQYIRNEIRQRAAEKFLRDPSRVPGKYAVVAVAQNTHMQRTFLDMGADVVILSEIAPSSEEFMEAFRLTGAKEILVFPNSANSILSSMQAGSLYKKARVTVLNSRSTTECYATLPVLDVAATVEGAVRRANTVLSNLYRFSVYHAVKDVTYGEHRIKKNDFFALASDKLLSAKESLEAATLAAFTDTLAEREAEIITLFYGRYISSEYVDYLLERLCELAPDAGISAVSTMESAYDITISFE